MAENYFYSKHSAQEMEDVFDGAVLSNKGQTLSTSQKAQARANIGAGSENTGFRVLGYFDTLEDLQEYLQLPPQAGDAYGIGTSVPYDIYVWDAANGEWVDNGPLDIAEFIDDTEVSSVLTWSSQKIKNELDEIDLSALIDDSDTAVDTTWSSNKISSELSGKATPADVAALVDDSTTSASKTWSSQKIAAEIDKCKWKLVWQNTSPTSNQGEQNVTLDLSAYKQLLFLFNRNPSNLAAMNIVWNAFFDLDTMPGAAVTAVTVVDTNGHFGRRIITDISSTGFHIQGGSKYNSYAGTATADNSVLILQYVYGREG